MQALTASRDLPYQTGVEAKLDESETPVSIWTPVPSTIPAVLVRRNGGAGSVYIIGENLPTKEPFLQTGPSQSAGYVLMIIKKNQSCHYYGKPSVRYFQPCPS